MVLATFGHQLISTRTLGEKKNNKSIFIFVSNVNNLKKNKNLLRCLKPDKTRQKKCGKLKDRLRVRMGEKAENQAKSGRKSSV